MTEIQSVAKETQCAAREILAQRKEIPSSCLAYSKNRKEIAAVIPENESILKENEWT